jgi:hypothetical protein
MSGPLDRRLTVLEQLAEEVRTRPIRRMVEDMAREHGFSPAETAEAVAYALARYDEALERRDALIRAGVSEREIIQRYADELSMPVAEFEAELERVTERYFT